MTTQKVDPDPGALERQHTFQRRTTTRRKVGAFAVAAAIALAALLVILAIRPGGNTTTPVPADEGATMDPAEPEAGPVGTVTFDGSTCSMEITADRIEPGIVRFEFVNATEQRAMFDSWELLDGYTVRAFEARIERDRQLAEAPGNRGTFPSESEVSYLGSDVIPANGSGISVSTMSPGRHAVVCLKLEEGAPPASERFRPFGIVGPIVVR